MAHSFLYKRRKGAYSVSKTSREYAEEEYATNYYKALVDDASKKLTDQGLKFIPTVR